MHASTRTDRRTTLKWVLAVAGSLSLPVLELAAASAGAPPERPSADANAVVGYGLDPKLRQDYRPGELWPLTLSEADRSAATALCDLIIPADEFSPRASALGVVDFLDEWISAPYPEQIQDKAIILEGLAWIDSESRRRFGRSFAELHDPERRSICDPISHVVRAAPRLQRAAEWFARFRDLTATGFYTTPQGRRDLNFVGNSPSTRFDGPPPDVLRRVGIVDIETEPTKGGGG